MAADNIDPGAFVAGYDCGHAVALLDAYCQGRLDGFGIGYRQGLEYAEWATRTEQEAWFDQQSKRLAAFLAESRPMQTPPRSAASTSVPSTSTRSCAIAASRDG